MKNVLLINADLYKTRATEMLMAAYTDGAAASEDKHHVKVLAIADLVFNFNKQFPNSSHAKLEADLEQAWNMMLWANHIVVFCPVFATYIPSKVSGFFERLFNQPEESVHAHSRKTLEGRSARIISVLDNELFNKWLIDKSNAFMSIKKEDFKRIQLNPVHTATIGYLRNLNNDYSRKWVSKLNGFGRKAI